MANRVMTVLEAHVPAERWSELEQAFGRLDAVKPAQLVQSFLVQSDAEPTVWRLLGIWQSREAFEEYRASATIPGGVQVLQSVGATPTMNLFEVKGS